MENQQRIEVISNKINKNSKKIKKTYEKPAR